jgi:hypothetical protein
LGTKIDLELEHVLFLYVVGITFLEFTTFLCHKKHLAWWYAFALYWLRRRFESSIRLVWVFGIFFPQEKSGGWPKVGLDWAGRERVQRELN